ncbi:MAG TPA: hypothetical protein PKZ34_00340, partial [Thermotogota bacterium]|nr:hypothetical protein [Thermotogota bacterium]
NGNSRFYTPLTLDIVGVHGVILSISSRAWWFDLLRTGAITLCSNATRQRPPSVELLNESYE